MADSITLHCPACGNQFTIVPPPIGQAVACPACQRAFFPHAPSMAPMPMSYASLEPTQGTSAMAIASLVCGCLFCIPIVGLLALIFGIIGLKHTKDRRTGGRGMAIAGTVLGGFGVLLWVAYLGLMTAILIPSLSRARETANRVKCASNMRQIGQAILLYSTTNL